jgi:hypothetical protein
MQIYRGYPGKTPDSAISQLCAFSVNAAGARAKIAPGEPCIEGLRPAQKLAGLEKL